MLVEGFDPRYIKMCYFATLGELGYKTRVSLANGLKADSPLVDDLHVSFEAFTTAGRRLGSVDPFEIIPPGGFTMVEVEDHVGPGRAIESNGEDVLGIFHLTPGKFVGKPTVDIDLSEIFARISVSDEYIEYHSDAWSVAAGLAYQSIPMNDPRFGGTRSTLMQSPKLLVDAETDTNLILLNISSFRGYDQEIAFELAFIAANGERLANHPIKVSPFGFTRVSSREVLREAGVLDRFIELGGNGMVVGFSDKGSVVPLSITRNDRSKGLACDHTLPPMYYLPWWGGAVRKAANQRVRELLFSGDAVAPR